MQKWLLALIDSPGAWLLIAFACILLASYLAWRDQYEIVDTGNAPEVILEYHRSFRRPLSYERDLPEFRAQGLQRDRIPVNNVGDITAYGITIEPIHKGNLTVTFDRIDVLPRRKTATLTCTVEEKQRVSLDGPIALFEQELTNMKITDWIEVGHKISVPIRLVFSASHEKQFFVDCTFEYDNRGQELKTINTSPKALPESRENPFVRRVFRKS